MDWIQFWEWLRKSIPSPGFFHLISVPYLTNLQDKTFQSLTQHQSTPKERISAIIITNLTHSNPHSIPPFQSCFHPLIHSRDQAPPHFLTIQVPVLAVLLRAPLLVSPASVYEEDSHEDGVRPRQEILESTSGTH